jgi:hypothetical protein
VRAPDAPGSQRRPTLIGVSNFTWAGAACPGRHPGPATSIRPRGAHSRCRRIFRDAGRERLGWCDARRIPDTEDVAGAQVPSCKLLMLERGRCRDERAFRALIVTPCRRVSRAAATNQLTARESPTRTRADEPPPRLRLSTPAGCRQSEGSLHIRHDRSDILVRDQRQRKSANDVDEEEEGLIVLRDLFELFARPWL